MAESELPLVPGEIVAWRAWQVMGGERLPFLRSVSHQSTMWHPGHWTHATCGGRETCRRSSDGRVPGESCSCGMYAARDRQHLVKLGYNRSGRDDWEPVVIGEVALAGKVIPGDQGWRAEKGRVKRLFLPFAHWRYLEPLRDLYGIEVELDNTNKVELMTLDELLRHYGQKG